jgi:hypothetical protein
MQDMNFGAIIGATMAAFLFSSIWYISFGKARMKLLGLWLGVFPVMILLGATLWDKRPWKLSAIHGGDWPFKIILVSAILGVWR